MTLEAIPDEVIRSRLQAECHWRGIDHDQPNRDLMMALDRSGHWREFTRKYPVIYTDDGFFDLVDVLRTFRAHGGDLASLREFL